MYEMIVPGKYPVQVPPHLAGTVAVSLGRRLAWRILATIIYGTLDVLLTFAPFYLLFIYRMSRDTFNTLNVITGVMAFAWLAFVILKLVRTGASPLMALTGVRWVRYDSGAPAGWAGLGKLLLQSIIGMLTFGVGSIIICFASMDEMNRTWFDRTLGIVPINTKAGRDTYKTPAPEPEEEPEPVVHPWNATSSAAASLPPVPTVPEKETETVHVPWGSDPRSEPGSALRSFSRGERTRAFLRLHRGNALVDFRHRCQHASPRGVRASFVLHPALVLVFGERVGLLPPRG